MSNDVGSCRNLDVKTETVWYDIIVMCFFSREDISSSSSCGTGGDAKDIRKMREKDKRHTLLHPLALLRRCGHASSGFF